MIVMGKSPMTGTQKKAWRDIAKFHYAQPWNLQQDAG